MLLQYEHYYYYDIYTTVTIPTRSFLKSVEAGAQQDDIPSKQWWFKSEAEGIASSFLSVDLAKENSRRQNAFLLKAEAIEL